MCQTIALRANGEEGQTPAEAPSVLEKLGIDAVEWSKMVKDFGRTFKNVAVVSQSVSSKPAVSSRGANSTSAAHNSSRQSQTKPKLRTLDKSVFRAAQIHRFRLTPPTNLWNSELIPNCLATFQQRPQVASPDNEQCPQRDPPKRPDKKSRRLVI